MSRLLSSAVTYLLQVQLIGNLLNSGFIVKLRFLCFLIYALLLCEAPTGARREDCKITRRLKSSLLIFTGVIAVTLAPGLLYIQPKLNVASAGLKTSMLVSSSESRRT